MCLCACAVLLPILTCKQGVSVINFYLLQTRCCFFFQMRFIMKSHQKDDVDIFLIAPSLSFLLALPVTQTRAHLPAHQSYANVRALPHHRPRRVRTWWRRVQTTPLTSPPPRLSRSSREHTPCSRHAAGERTQR